MNLRQSGKRPFEQDTSEPPAKRPRRSAGMEPDSIEAQILRLCPQDLEEALEIVKLLRESSKTRLDADEQWYEDGGYEKEQEHLAARERELETTERGIKIRQGFQQANDKSAELDREERKIRVKREEIRRELDGLAAQARSLDLRYLAKLTGHHCVRSTSVEPAMDKAEGEVVVLEE
ncbi:uncharacterized protein FFB20_09097 [Fusarium fujikuroi]|nr:Uncharacterized protein LW94_1542 [Fusarium fujikuroi]SCN91918.1 uncharacterized protein FFB20_09097 [Fusarium fujikuroi]SCO23948.1 uncharacterized protein FFE2_15818 [Fusarium fujikuroi]SCO53827.1 uncharacterized protein FFNC_15206 [Fusarium fujikuroi]SCO58638.1 uncharacterized protein FFMR_15794 [Fusarium fujikuroi]